MNLVAVPLLSEDFGRIEYEIQLQLDAPRLVVDECFELSNPHISAQFKTFCKSMSPQNIVDVFVPTTQLKQTVDDIASKGIKVDSRQGFHFTVGRFDVEKSAEKIEVIRLSVALGRTLNYQPSSSAEPTAEDLRNGYHSLFIPDKNEYCVFNSAQILTLNLVRFAGGANLNTTTSEDNTCDKCGKEEATVWCINDAAKLCASCDQELHSQKVTKNHKRVSLAEARPMIEFCPFHPDQRVEYYCPQCNCPVCYKCKMTGSHSKGPSATHPLVEIKVAYNRSREELAHEDPIIARRKKIIEEKIKYADSKLESIEQNERDIEEEITNLANAAIKQAKELTGDKRLIIQSAKTELERKQNEINALTSFIENQKKFSSPLSFLRAFDRYGLLVGTLQETNDLPPELKVEADLCVFGSFNVGTTDKPPNQDESNQQQSRSVKKHGSSKNSPSQHFQSTIRENYYDNEDEYEDNVTEEEDNQEPISSATLPDNDYQQRDVSFSADSTSNRQKANQKPRQSSSGQQQKKNNNKQSLKRKSDAGPEYTSLIALAQRREQKNKARGLELTFQPFSGTQIINSTALCTALYLCFPFKAQPQTHLLFSTERDGRSIKKMHEMIDGIGITAVLVKKGEFVFGGFAAAKWNHDGEPFGEGSSSFLFSLSQDAFIPFKPRINDSCHLFATENSLTFGKYDLILEDNFDKCSAIIENSYGIGFRQGSTEAQTFLAGQPVFKADIVEVWGFFTIEQQ